ncbi:helix-turn-helix transcriptional regulator [Bacillus sp. NEB1478]|uniref:helix-turn-helix domain-containing protein n=1 Tax=Bacillus sp. NEB1478 TaxID=3073816 RepID=UPI002872B075|nr:helix-turn-helix transcriptional regulator [Bacillus sp. NEB1478]WNB93415.1 helix-turn-helix transcriptional regulator [Bacillus sp. NEB1478]
MIVGNLRYPFLISQEFLLIYDYKRDQFPFLTLQYNLYKDLILGLLTKPIFLIFHANIPKQVMQIILPCIKRFYSEIMEEGVIIMSFGSNLNYYRVNKGLTLKQLSDELNVSVNYLSTLERDKGKIKPEFIPKLCTKLHIEIKDLFREDLPKIFQRW